MTGGYLSAIYTRWASPALDLTSTRMVSEGSTSQVVRYLRDRLDLKPGCERRLGYSVAIQLPSLRRYRNYVLHKLSPNARAPGIIFYSAVETIGKCNPLSRYGWQYASQGPANHRSFCSAHPLRFLGRLHRSWPSQSLHALCF